jgi:hypothetical protein
LLCNDPDKTLQPHYADISNASSSCIATHTNTHIGSACIAANSDCGVTDPGRKIGVLVNDTTNNGYAGSYMGSRAVIVPSVRNTSSWSTEVRVMHVSGSGTATIRITYYHPDGTRTNLSAPVTHPIAGSGYNSVRVTDSAIAPLPASPFQGSMVITSDQDIIAVVTHRYNNTNSGSMMTNAINR